ncbi:MAG: hypothetical protein LQ350_008583 [Teloschistes chrysophthalmus]|nr:MAG: hypothetical protein LQ350_008583 [Niorma chrysophthalma]
MSTPTSIRALSKLPRELRDEIYAEVLDFSTSPPKSPTDEAVSESDQREEDQGWGVIYYQRHFPSTNLAGLLGCNHQIRDEVLDLIKVEAGGIAYSVDLMIWENSIQPTWMELPTPPKYTKQLNVTLRMFSHTGPQWGESGILGQYLLQMLRRFLYDGPSFATDPPGRRDSRPLYPLHLEELTIVLEAMKTKVDDKTGAPEKNPEEIARRRLSAYISKFVRSGLLYGKIDTIRMWYAERSTVWHICDNGDRTESARRWGPFGWGPVLQITQKIVDNGSVDYSEELDCVPPDPVEIERRRRELEDFNPDVDFVF